MTRQKLCLCTRSTILVHFFSYFSMGNERLTTTADARCLKVVLDNNMLFDVHVSDICRSKSYQLRNLSRISKYLTQESCEIAVHAFITSKLDYCNSLLYGCRKMELKKLQYVQKTQCRQDHYLDSKI